MAKSLKDLFDQDCVPVLSQLIQVPPYALRGKYKCRVEYDAWGQSVHFEPYRKKVIRHLHLVEAPELSYKYKFADRAALGSLLVALPKTHEVIIMSGGFLRDTTYTNIALSDGHRWYTPAQPLLEGTTRARLLDAGTLQLAEIHKSNLPRFESIKLFNAMTGWQHAWRMHVGQITI